MASTQAVDVVDGLCHFDQRGLTPAFGPVANFFLKNDLGRRRRRRHGQTVSMSSVYVVDVVDRLGMLSGCPSRLTVRPQ